MDLAQARADAYLLIAEALQKTKMAELYSYGIELGLEALVEFHDEENAKRIAEINSLIVGVNCRNLKTMTTDISYFEKMIAFLPAHAVKVAESGIYSSSDLNYVADLGYDAVLVGTSLMKTGKPGMALERLLGGVA